MNKIKKGDTVMVLTGSAKKTVSEVLRAIPKDGKVIVKGVNKKTSVRKTGSEKQLVTREYPIDASNVALVDTKTNKAVRAGFLTEKSGKKVRIARQTGAVI